ncbi:ABC transporter permease [Micromonospora pisi]|uniref:ABC transporter permease n=1 Tax=Micromonospora pisi TaxID=589240 RepID=UPI001FE86F11|nr:ABC transporter permease [Micromonospora pisi]
MTRRAYPWTYFTSTVLSGSLIVALAYLAFRAVGPEGVSSRFTSLARSVDYVGYVAVGAVTYTFAVRMILWTAKALITEEREGTFVALVVTPARRMPYLLGFVMFAVLSTLAEAGAIAGVAALLGVQLVAPDPLGLTLGLTTFIVALFAISMLLGAVMLVVAEAHISQNTVFLTMGLVCGFTFPREYLPTAAQWFAEAVPVTAALDVLRAALSGGFEMSQAGPRLLATLCVSAAYLVAGLWLLPRAERRTVERTF